MNNDDKSKHLDPVALIQDFYFHEGERVSHRIDWFLLFHAILIEAFLTASDSDSHSGLADPIAFFGLLLALFWFAIGIRANWISKHLSKLLTTREITGPRFAG